MVGGKIVAVIVGLSLLVGCTQNPYTGQAQVSKAGIGAGVGAAAGAGVGALTSKKHRLRNALIGAGVGALAGGAVGYYMDRQEAVLRERLQHTGVSVTRVGDSIILNMPGHITFDSGSSAIKPRFQEVLGSVALVLNEYEQTYLEVVGHTDSVGAADYNQGLSERRAEAVAANLASRDVLRARLLVSGRGERHPVASNMFAAGRQENRRVEIEIVPFQG